MHGVRGRVGVVSEHVRDAFDNERIGTRAASTWLDGVAVCRRVGGMAWLAQLAGRHKIAIGLSALVVLIVLAIISLPELLTHGTFKSDAQRLKAENDVRTTLVQLVGGTILLVGLYFTFRTLQLNREGQITERFTRAIDQLGSDKVDVCLGGIYSLARIASESERDHWPIMQVLTAFVREHARWSDQAGEDSPSLKLPSGATRSPPEAIQAALTVLVNRCVDRERRNQRLDLSHTDLRGAILNRISLKGANLTGAHLSEAWLEHADLEGAWLEQADLSGAHLEYAVLSHAHLDDAVLHNAKLKLAVLVEADFSRARLRGATLLEADLTGCTLREAHIQFANFGFASLEGAILVEACAQNAFFTAARLKGASFYGARLHRAMFGNARDIDDANFDGAIYDEPKPGDPCIDSAS
jgi:uncharacterized protein YjbI with pentapeptide repeats